MVDITRRSLLKAAALLPLAATPLAWAAGNGSTQPRRADFTFDPHRSGRRVQPGLASLSFETRELVNPAFFSASNHELVQLCRSLNPHGVLRLGGNTSDYAIWAGYRGALPTVVPSRTRDPKRRFTLHAAALKALAGFLDATGWRLIFGVNLKIGVPAMADDLARAVRAAVGDHLLAVQIGNEPNNYEASYAAFDRAWKPYAKVLRSGRMPIGGPDTGANTDWVEAYTREHGAANVFLSRHYYRGPASDGSLRDMLSGDLHHGDDNHDVDFYPQAAALVRAGDAVGLPFRLTEAGSYYEGGREGVSDVFASALWGADFMLAMAQRGVASVHFHGGTLQSVDASLGRNTSAPAAGNLAARRDAASSVYSPIAGDLALGFQPRPLYWGMALAQRFVGADMLPGTLDAGGVNLTAYAAKRRRSILIALINKDSAHDVVTSVRGLPAAAEGRVQRLHAPSLISRDGAAFDAAQGVATDASGIAHMAVPRGSAALVEWAV